MKGVHIMLWSDGEGTTIALWNGNRTQHQNKSTVGVRDGCFQNYSPPKINGLGRVFHHFLFSPDQLVTFHLMVFCYMRGLAGTHCSHRFPLTDILLPPAPRDSLGPTRGPIQVSAPDCDAAVRKCFADVWHELLDSQYHHPLIRHACRHALWCFAVL